MLDDLDTIDWAALGSATGTAVRVPALLRAIAAGEEPAATAAVDDLFNEMYHQETIWQCTAPAVPYVVELTLVPALAHRDVLVSLLASLSRAGLTELVDADIPRLVALLADPDPNVRQCAAYLIAWHDKHAELTMPLLLDHYQVEPDPLARASMLAAVGALDRTAGRALAGKALRDPDPVLRAAGGLVLVWMREWWSKKDVPLPKHAATTVAEAFASTDPLDRWVWSSNALSEVIEGFADVKGAQTAMLGLMLRAPSADLRRNAVYEVDEHIRQSRSAPAALLPLLRPLLDDPDPAVRRAVTVAIRQAGSAAGLLADDLARVAGDNDALLAVLVLLDDPRWQALARAAWQRSEPLEALAEAIAEAPAPTDAEFVAALTARLAAIVRVDAARDERDSLAMVASECGADVSALLVDALDWEVARDRARPFTLCQAIGVLGVTPTPASLHTAAKRSFHGADRLEAGLTIWRLTGDPTPALTVAECLLDGPNGYDEQRQAWLYPEAVARLSPLGAELAPLVPSLRRHLAEYPDRHKANCAIAGMLWRLHGNPDEVLPVFRAALSITPQSAHDYRNHPPTEALKAVPELGAHGTVFVDLLRTIMRSPVGWVRLRAAANLARLGAIDRDELLARVVPDPSRLSRWSGRDAMSALDLVTEFDLTEARPRLAGWLAQDQRLSGDPSGAVRLDENFQARARQLIG